MASQTTFVPVRIPYESVHIVTEAQRDWAKKIYADEKFWDTLQLEYKKSINHIIDNDDYDDTVKAHMNSVRDLWIRYDERQKVLDEYNLPTIATTGGEIDYDSDLPF